MVLCFVLLMGAMHPPVTTYATDNLEIQYIANEGVRIAADGKQVLIDALHRPYRPQYACLPEEQREALEQALPPWNAVDLVLVTHIHRDHFHAEAVGRHLQHNPKAMLVCGQQAGDAVARDFPAFESISKRVIAHTPALHQAKTVQANGIKVDVLSTRHGGQNHTAIENICYIVYLNNRKLLHLGDAEMSHANFQAFHLDQKGIDIAFIPYWFLISETGAAVVRETIKPKQIIAVHIAPDEADSIMNEIHKSFPDAIGFTKLLQQIKR